MPADLFALVPFAALLLAAGVIAGIIAGMLGVGGGLVVVPVLFHLFTHFGIDEAVRMKVAVGTSLATIVATGWSSARSHWKRGSVDPAFLRSYGPIIFAGVLAGTVVATWVRGPVLTGVFATVALVVAVHIAFGKPHWRLGDRLPAGAGRVVIGGLIGLLSAMMGIGGGTMTVPVMTLYGYPVHRAVGTAAAMGFVIGIPGTLGFVVGGWGVAGVPPMSLGYVSLLGLALIAPTSMLCAPWGARIAHALDTRMLKRAFAAFLAVSAVRMFWTILV